MAKRTKTSTQSTAISPRASAAASCGCAASGSGQMEAGAGVGPGAPAAGVDPELKVANLKHLRRIEGQVRGIAAMVDEDRYCADIITQISAVRESLHAVARNLLRNHLTHCASVAMREGASKGDEMTEELLDLVGKLAR